MDNENQIDILKLAELLKPPEEESPSNEDSPLPDSHIKNERQSKCTIDPDMPKTMEEFQAQFDSEAAIMDDRIEPNYDIKYRQAVTAEDIFLQMGPKTPSSTCCEDMVITANLVGEVFSALDLKLFPSKIKLSGVTYKLDLDLPHSICPDKSKAKWVNESETLILTLRMAREYDFINF